MSFAHNAVDQLGPGPWGYRHGSTPAAEPTALAALALIGLGRPHDAAPALDWLTELQGHDGGVGISKDQPTPCWPTGLAVLAWVAASPLPFSLSPPATSAVAWMLATSGKPTPRSETMGHDTTLRGWPWVVGTHSWLEPTATHVLALRAAGQGLHPRTREAESLLLDRLLPAGGCNYGNTVVLGQTLRPHIQPTGLVLLALGSLTGRSEKLARSIEFLERTLSDETTTASLCYGLMGLAAQGVTMPMAEAWLDAAHARTISRGASPLELALLALASLGPRSPLIHPMQSVAA